MTKTSTKVLLGLGVFGLWYLYFKKPAVLPALAQGQYPTLTSSGKQQARYNAYVMAQRGAGGGGGILSATEWLNQFPQRDHGGNPGMIQ